MIGLGRIVGLVWVARHESYARAARAFPYPITQPGLHQQIKRLEGELDVVLFERVAKDRVVPTPAARRLLAICEPFLTALDETVEALERGAARLRIEASALVLRQIVAEWARRLRAELPDIELRLGEIQRPTPARLLAGDVDVLVDFLPELPDSIASRRVGTARAYLVAPSALAPARLRLAALGDTDFIAYPEGTLHRALQLEALARAGVTPRHITSVGSADSILSLVRAGLGYSLVPWIGAAPDVDGVVARRQTRAGATFPIVAAWRRSSERDPAIRAALALAPR